MSAQEQEPAESYGPSFLGAGGASLHTLALYSDASLVADATDVAEADTVISELVDTGNRVLSDEEAAANRAMWSVVQGGVDNGVLTPEQLPGFFRWLWADQGVVSVSAAFVASGALAGYLLRYAEAHGYSPPAPENLPPLANLSPFAIGLEALIEQADAYPLPNLSPYALGLDALIAQSQATVLPVNPALTTGQRATASGAAAVTPQQTTAPGLSQSAALAVQKAIGVATADMYRVMAKTFDLYLPGMHPGQVPASLSDLFTAAAVLERQVHALQLSAKGLTTTATKAELTGLETSLTELASEVAAVRAELDLHAPSALDTHVNVVDEAVTKNTSDIERIEKALEDLAGVAGVASLATKVDKLVSQMDLTEPSALDTQVNAVDKVAQDAARVAEDAEQCCEATTGNLERALTNVGGQSALQALGNLVAKAFGVTFLLGLADTLLALADMPAVIKATAWDAETVAGYAETAAGIVEADFDWAGGWSGG